MKKEEVKTPIKRYNSPVQKLSDLLWDGSEIPQPAVPNVYGFTQPDRREETTNNMVNFMAQEAATEAQIKEQQAKEYNDTLRTGIAAIEQSNAKKGLMSSLAGLSDVLTKSSGNQEAGTNLQASMPKPVDEATLMNIKSKLMPTRVVPKSISSDMMKIPSLLGYQRQLDLTEQANKQNYDLSWAKLNAEKEGEKKGKILPTSSADKIADYDDAVIAMNKLSTAISKSKGNVGPLAGFSKYNPYDVEAQELQAIMKDVKQRVGKTKEGGVLRKEDEKKYDEILAGMRDQPEVALFKLKNLVISMIEERNNRLKNYEKAGYDRTNFGDTSELDYMTDEQLQEKYKKLKGASK